jgi:hypothetical protein
MLVSQRSERDVSLACSPSSTKKSNDAVRMKERSPVNTGTRNEQIKNIVEQNEHKFHKDLSPRSLLEQTSDIERS